MKSHRYRKCNLKNNEQGINLTLKDELRADATGIYMIYSVVESTSIVVRLMNLSEETVYSSFQSEVLAWTRMREERPTIPVKMSS